MKGYPYIWKTGQGYQWKKYPYLKKLIILGPDATNMKNRRRHFNEMTHLTLTYSVGVFRGPTLLQSLRRRLFVLLRRFSSHRQTHFSVA